MTWYVFGHAQNQANIWYFANNNGLDFNSGTPPTVLTNGQGTNFEGAAAICDNNGVLLFYTNGQTCWNRNHMPMPNGSGLMAGSSSAQGAMIIPDPGNGKRYYLFTAPSNAGANGYRYSIVNMNLQFGLGDIETATKNSLLLAAATEKQTAVRHQNGTDYWVIAHNMNNSEFYAFQISATGVGTPVISNIGWNHSAQWPGIGQMKASHNGCKIAVAVCYSSVAEFFDFDRSTGLLSNVISISGVEDPYGVEWSPNDQYVYFSSRGPWAVAAINQFDIRAGSSAAIIASKSYVYYSVTTANYGCMQLAPDGKIYVANTNGSYLGVINLPNNQAAAVNYIFNGFYLQGNTVQQGLPNYYPDLFYEFPDFTFGNLCTAGDTSFFSMSNQAGVDSVKWNFGDPASVPMNSSTDFDAWHIFSQTGLFTVTLVSYKGCTPDTVFKIISIGGMDSLFVSVVNENCSFGNDGIVNLTVVGGTTPFTYQWSNGATTEDLTGLSSGVYSVIVTDASGCNAYAIANVGNGSPGGIAGLWTWTGIQSSDWFEPCNWDKLTVPDLLKTVLIPGATFNNPSIASGTGQCLEITIDEQNGAQLYISALGGASLVVAQ